MECVRLRLKDLDFQYKTVTVRDGKGEKDRITPLPDSLIAPLRRQMERVPLLHEEDLAAGFGRVYLPHTLEKKYSNAATELTWQYLFPAPKRSMDLVRLALCVVIIWNFLRLAAICQGGSSPVRYSQARHLSYISAFLRHPSPAKWIRY